MDLPEERAQTGYSILLHVKSVTQVIGPISKIGPTADSTAGALDDETVTGFNSVHRLVTSNLWRFF